MDIPQELKDEIEKISNIGHLKVIEESQSISKKYRENDGKGKKLVTKQSEAIAYAISRMPSTYGAVYSTITQCLKNYKENIKTVLDIGAGTGAATWAITNLIDANNIICLEREDEMRKVGKQLMKQTLPNVEWRAFDLCEDEIKENADLVISSYVINELNQQNRQKAIEKMWNATEGILIIIEPGTPEGFLHILETREMLLEKGANIVAPCTHNGKCHIDKNDWCSFYVRVARSKIHKQAKNGELGYEDEKFSYIAFSKTPINQESAVILRRPQISTGYVKVRLCTKDGIEDKTYTKKDKEIYKKIKKLNAGETI